MGHHAALEVRWVRAYVGLAWLAELGNGAIQTITGQKGILTFHKIQPKKEDIQSAWVPTKKLRVIFFKKISVVICSVVQDKVCKFLVKTS